MSANAHRISLERAKPDHKLQYCRNCATSSHSDNLYSLNLKSAHPRPLGWRLSCHLHSGSTQRHLLDKGIFDQLLVSSGHSVIHSPTRLSANSVIPRISGLHGLLQALDDVFEAISPGKLVAAIAKLLETR